MNDEQKEALRKIEILEKGNCNNCFTRSNNSKLHGSVYAFNYCTTTCSIGLKIQELGKTFDSHTISRKRWSKDEMYYLINHYKYFPVDHLAKRLNRDVDAVYEKLKSLLKQEKTNVC